MGSRAPSLLHLSTALALVAVLLAVGCTPLADKDTAATTGTIDPALIAAQNRFGLDLYQRLASRSKENDPGVFVSPSSIAMALAMTYNGARGETKVAMAHTLGLDSLSLDNVNDSYRALLQQGAGASPSNGGVELRVANGLWQHEGIAFNKDFLRRNQLYYGATVRSLDFTDPGSVGIINRWVSEQTKGLIPSLLDQIAPESVLFLINAIYFKGDWEQPFDPHRTRLMPFHSPGGGSTVQMMHKEGTFHHYQGEGFQAVRLPYGEDGRMAMYVFLPDRGSSLEGFHELLTYENWEQWLAGFAPKRGRVALPRFRLEYRAQLNEALKELGMGTAFDAGRADFSGMRPVSAAANLFISEVIHQSVLQVNEEGAEAAGATSVGVQLTSAPVYQFNFVADRPFFLVIRDDKTGAMLFLGSVQEPAKL